MRALYRWVNTTSYDLLQGAGDRLGVIRALGVGVLAHVPELAEILASAMTSRDVMGTLQRLTDQNRLRQQRRMSREAIMEAIEEEVMATVGEETCDETVEELGELSEELDSSPEVDAMILANRCAYQYAIQCDLALLHGLVAAFKWIGKQAGKEAVEIADSGEYSNTIEYLRHMRMEIIKGFTGASLEQKTTMQIMFLGAYAVAHGAIPLEDVEKFIIACNHAVEWGVAVFQHGAWAPKRLEAAREFTVGFNDVIGRCTAFLESAKPKPRFLIEVPSVTEIVGRNYGYPCSFFLVDKDTWLGGAAAPLKFTMLEDFPYKTTQHRAGISIVLGLQGSGKTTINMSLVSTAVHDGLDAVVLKSDASNQPMFMCLPAFGREMNDIIEFLREKMGVEPHPLPTMFLNVIRPSQRDLLRNLPMTPWDRVIEADPEGFHLDWGLVADEAQKVHDDFPFPSAADKPDGTLIVTKNLGREEQGGAVDVDLQIMPYLDVSFKEYRRHHGGREVELYLDELHDLAAREFSRGEAGSDKSKTGGRINQTIKQCRHLNINMVATTIQPQDVIGQPLATASNIICKNLPTSQMEQLFDKQRGIIKGLSDKEREVVMRLNADKVLEENYLWFWWNNRIQGGEMNLVHSCPPPTYMKRIKMDAMDIFRRYQAETGEKVLQKWSEIDWEKITIAKAADTATTRRTLEEFAEQASDEYQTKYEL